MKKKQRPSLDRKTDNTYDQGQGWTHLVLVVIMKKKQRTPKQEDTYTTHMIQDKEERLSSGTTSSDYEKKQRPPRQGKGDRQHLHIIYIYVGKGWSSSSIASYEEEAKTSQAGSRVLASYSPTGIPSNGKSSKQAAVRPFVLLQLNVLLNTVTVEIMPNNTRQNSC